MNRELMQLEISVDSLASAVAAQQGGAHRLDLCSPLAEAGVAPSIGFIRAVRHQLDIEVRVMIRRGGGDFLYSEDEVCVMREDIRDAAESGADGVVLGLLTRSGDIHVVQPTKLIERAGPMKVTFHRAIDMTRDLDTAVRDAGRTGADGLLTSGGQQRTLLGAEKRGRMARSSGDEIQIMVCGGVRAERIGDIVQQTGGKPISRRFAQGA